MCNLAAQCRAFCKKVIRVASTGARGEKIHGCFSGVRHLEASAFMGCIIYKSPVMVGLKVCKEVLKLGMLRFNQQEEGLRVQRGDDRLPNHWES